MSLKATTTQEEKTTLYMVQSVETSNANESNLIQAVALPSKPRFINRLAHFYVTSFKCSVPFMLTFHSFFFIPFEFRDDYVTLTAERVYFFFLDRNWHYVVVFLFFVTNHEIRRDRNQHFIFREHFPMKCIQTNSVRLE